MTYDRENKPASVLSKEMEKYFRSKEKTDISRDELEEALLYALSELPMRDEKEDHLVISSKKETYILEKKKILYIERSKRDTYIHMEEERIRVPDRLSVLEEKLDKGSFIRCHNSFIVNMDCVKERWKEGFRMKNGMVIPVSRSRQKEVKELFEQWIRVG